MWDEQVRCRLDIHVYVIKNGTSGKNPSKKRGANPAAVAEPIQGSERWTIEKSRISVKLLL
jgi:hypothetical protein